MKKKCDKGHMHRWGVRVDRAGTVVDHQLELELFIV